MFRIVKCDARKQAVSREGAHLAVFGKKAVKRGTKAFLSPLKKSACPWLGDQVHVRLQATTLDPMWSECRTSSDGAGINQASPNMVNVMVAAKITPE